MGKSMTYNCDKSSERNRRVKVRAPKKSLSSEILGQSKSSSTKRMIKATRSKNSITASGQESSTGLFTEFDVANLSNDEELGNTFDKLWRAVKSGMEKNCQSFGPRSTPIDAKMSEIQNRIMLNQVILQSANEKLKSVNFKTERQNFTEWREKVLENFSQEDGSMRKDVKALDLEIEKLKQRKSDKNVFLKSSPGIANFHKTMESTLTMLDKIQNTKEFQDYDKGIHAIKAEFDLDYIKAPNVITVSDEE